MPTPDDVEALQGTLEALRRRPRDELRAVSTHLLMHAGAMAHGGHSERAKAILLLARVAYVLADEDQHPPSPL
jgi:hypothetical protein